MPRPTTSTLRSRLRRMIADTGTAQIFTEDELERYLDQNRTEVRYAPLQAEPDLGPGGSVAYKVYFSGLENWEEGARLLDPSFADVTHLATQDSINGRFEFQAHQGPPVYVKGYFFDLHGAAADALEAWASMEKLAFDFSTDGQSFKSSQKADALERQAAHHRRRARVGTGSIRQSDFNR